MRGESLPHRMIDQDCRTTCNERLEARVFVVQRDEETTRTDDRDKGFIFHDSTTRRRLCQTPTRSREMTPRKELASTSLVSAEAGSTTCGRAANDSSDIQTSIWRRAIDNSRQSCIYHSYIVRIALACPIYASGCTRAFVLKLRCAHVYPTNHPSHASHPSRHRRAKDTTALI